ncbi:hypothetical protein AALC17_09860 [Oscillospiraceae bacterium 38-13]
MAEAKYRHLWNNVEHLRKVGMVSADNREILERAPWLRDCAFCCEPLRDLRDDCRKRWYVSEDLSACVCAGCYVDFQDRFQWTEADRSGIDWRPPCPHCGRKMFYGGCQDYPWSCMECHILISWDFEDELYVGRLPNPFY